MSQKSYDGYIGIDVAKDKVDVALSEHELNTFPNTLMGFELLRQALSAYRHPLIVLEASGGYEKAIAYYLISAGFAVAIVNAKRVRDYAKSQGFLAKTDRIDARLIRAYGKISLPREQAMQREDQQMLVGWLQRRRQVVKLMAMEKQHAEKALPCVKEAIQKMLTHLARQRQEIDEYILHWIKQQPALLDRIQTLQKVTGIGEIVARTLAIALPELGELTGKAIASLVGVAPFNHDSGQYRGKRAIKGGRSEIRQVLYMAILSAIRYNKAINHFYNRLIVKGKPKKVAMVACMRKLLVMINAMIKHQSQWQPDGVMVHGSIR